MADTDNAAAPAAATPVVSPAAAPKLPIDPSKSYRLKLSRAVEIAPKVWARPAHEAVVKGSLIADLGDAVIGYEEV
ncbi:MULTISPECIES: hypothetical protein [unclassified Bradyrhizobium]|uniref:hypothetical protein n=1 Tax=unclassified Bradyrhizobium TaxID=2631580 RepID=UPI002916F9BD|nr:MULTISPECIES: hypothetical protein [unclassified Bradyrhizobium]